MSLEELIDIERSFWKSSGDQDYYRDHVAEGGRFVLSAGVMEKDDVVASMAEAEPWDSFEIRDPTMTPISDDVVGLIYDATGRREAGGDRYHANILSVYRKHNGGWQLVLHQQTPIDS